MVALIAGVGIGWIAHGPTQPDDRTTATGHLPNNEYSNSTFSPIASTAPDACPSQLALLRAAYDNLEREAYGPPRPFPENLPSAYTPAGFREAIAALQRECPDLADLELGHIDCDEFPCSAWFVSKVGRGGNSELPCPAWERRYGTPPQPWGNGSLMRDGEPLAYLYLSAQPDGTEYTDEHKLRLKTRNKANKERLLDETGARELTPRERHERDLAFWLDRLAAAEDAGENTDMFHTAIAYHEDALAKLDGAGE